MTIRGDSLESVHAVVVQYVAKLRQEMRFSLNKRLLVIVLLFITAFSIRLYHINEPPLNFHATRQYRSLLIARAYYYESVGSIPEWKREVAAINRQRQGILEPPIMERLVSVGYRLHGAEDFWIPRLLSTLFWLLGGSFLYGIAMRIADTNAALFSTAFYLLLPFAVIASRSFQPDPLMVALLLASILAVLRYYDRPSSVRLAVAAAVSALTFFVKPISLFAVLGVFMSLAVWRYGVRRSLASQRLFLFLTATLLPTLTFYLYGIFVAGFLRAQAQASFLPQLWLDPFFWKGWFNNTQVVVGLTTFIVALAGVLMFQTGLPRAVMIGLWAGYAIFCLVFNYHIATHDYYHLQLVPIVALSLGPVVTLVVNRLLEINREWYWRAAVWSILLLVLLVNVGAAGVRLRTPDFDSQVGIAEEIGGQVNHSTKSIFLSGDYGLSLEYHGELSGEPWPLASDLEWERLAGVPVLRAGERFAAWFASEAPDYFIVMDMREFEAQADLKHFLSTNFSIVARTPHYLIFDLRDRNTEHEEGRKRLTERTERKTLFSL